MKTSSQFVCQQCGYVSIGQMGKCPNCGSWNSFVETVTSPVAEKRLSRSAEALRPQKLSEVKQTKEERILTGISELDRVLGGGIVPGSVVLVAGEPGIGKSTLLLTFSAKLGGLYVSGEESVEQIKLRADRLGIKNSKLKLAAGYNVDAICDHIAQDKPFLVIVDSIQTMTTEDLSGAAGSVGQVRECASRLHRVAKDYQIPLFLIGHVTKEGAIAGPKVLEHLVDAVLQLEGERYQNLRILRVTKNRFGATDEVGVFAMEDKGMSEITNPSELFLSDSTSKIGSCVVCTMEGVRPLLVEIQALVVSTSIPVPRRVVSGVDYNRVQLLCAILQKHLKLPLYSSDVFVNVAGGMKVLEPAADLGIALSIVSSFKNQPLGKKVVAIGEVGLLGEVRRVSQLPRRVKEAKKLGFTHVLSSEIGRNFSELLVKSF